MAGKKRRGPSEGNIRKRDDGRWEARISFQEPGKPRKQISLYGKTHKEVAEQLTRLRSKRQQGISVTPERQTVTAFLQQWLENMVYKNKRPATYARYKIAVESHIKPNIGHHRLQKLSTQHVQTMFGMLQEKGLSPASIRRVRDVLRNALNVAMKWDLVSRNVAALAELPQAPRYHPTILTPALAQQLFDAIAGDRLEALYWMALLLGMREGELLGLRWPDIDIQRRTVTINGTLYFFESADELQRAQRTMAGYVLQVFTDRAALVRTKTERSRRVLPLPTELIPILQQHRVRQLEDRLLASRRWTEYDLVFPSTVGTPISRHNLIRSFQAKLKHAGLPRMRFHNLRHSTATLLALQKVDVRTISEILGHSNTSTTTNIYMHVLDAMQDDAIASVGKLFGAAENEILTG